MEGQSADFGYSFLPAWDSATKTSFREEAMRAAELIDQKREGRPVALCYSGGVDSELIAICLQTLGIPFEMYFLDIWGINRAAFLENSLRFLARIGKRVNVVELEKESFYQNHSCLLFRELGCEFPTYLALTWLFDQIPADRFLLVGDGDFNREGPLFQEIGRKHSRRLTTTGVCLPFSTAAVVYYAWARRRNRAGEFYFFSSTPGIIAAMVSDPLFDFSFPCSSTRRVIHHHFPEIAERPKTTNWDGEAYLENRRIRHWLEKNVRNYPELRFWRHGLGTMVRVSDLFF